MITNKIRKISTYGLTKYEIDLINSVKYTEDKEDFFKSQIKKYVTKKYPLEILVLNWNEILLLGRDSSSKQSYITRYGEDIGIPLFEKKQKMSSKTKEDYIEEFGEEDAIKKLAGRGASLSNYINRHGEIEGLKRWKLYCKKRKIAYAKGRSEGKYASRNLKWFQNKHGNEQGYKIWDKKRKDQAYKVSKAYYIKKYGEIEGRKICRDTKARDLPFFIKKYGEIEGRKRHEKMIIKVFLNRKSGTCSKWALEICNTIKEYIPDLLYYGNNEMILGLSKEYEVYLGQKIIMPDLFYRGKIIEFQGDLFHGNPLLFEDNSHPHPFNKSITAKELQEKDKNRFDYYKSKQYKVLEIWESEYTENKNKVIEKCLTFLK